MKEPEKEKVFSVEELKSMDKDKLIEMILLLQGTKGKEPTSSSSSPSAASPSAELSKKPSEVKQQLPPNGKPEPPKNPPPSKQISKEAVSQDTPAPLPKQTSKEAVKATVEPPTGYYELTQYSNKTTASSPTPEIRVPPSQTVSSTSTTNTSTTNMSNNPDNSLYATITMRPPSPSTSTAHPPSPTVPPIKSSSLAPPSSSPAAPSSPSSTTARPPSPAVPPTKSSSLAPPPSSPSSSAVEATPKQTQNSEIYSYYSTDWLRQGTRLALKALGDGQTADPKWLLLQKYKGVPVVLPNEIELASVMYILHSGIILLRFYASDTKEGEDDEMVKAALLTYHRFISPLTLMTHLFAA